jgi:hypothetical protein
MTNDIRAWRGSIYDPVDTDILIDVALDRSPHSVSSGLLLLIEPASDDICLYIVYAI